MTVYFYHITDIIRTCSSVYWQVVTRRHTHEHTQTEIDRQTLEKTPLIVFIY